MNPLTSPLLADLYQFTMLQSSLEQDMEETAVFELFVRKLPLGRNFMVAAGLKSLPGGTTTTLQNLKMSNLMRFLKLRNGWRMR